MAIEISVIKSPEHVQLSKVCQVFTEQGGTIGRGEGNTWVIEDPDRFISTTHSRIVFENGQYYLSDLSTNGTFINGSSEPIGNGNRVLLKDGDRFSLSDYEFSVNLQGNSNGGFAGGDDPFGGAAFANPEPFANQDYADAHDPFSDYADPFAGSGPVSPAYADPLPVVEPEETDPLAALDKANHRERHNPFLDPEPMPSQADNADPMQQAVAWPSVIPEDWDDEGNRSAAPEPAPAVIPAAPVPGEDVAQQRGVLEKLQRSEQRREELEDENSRLLSEIMQLKQKLKNMRDKPFPAKPARGGARQIDTSLLEAMGLGERELSDARKAEISATVGLLMRESIAGLMQALGFRKKIKEEFRINVTTIQPVENNPLKFSANIEDALENMFVKDNKAYMKPLDAVREGFQGISEHQIAVLAGIQAAFRGMIERLDPEALEKRFEKYRKTGVIKVGQKGKNWESYKEFHQDLVNNLDNSFQYLFGYDFVQAYEEQLQRLVAARKARAKEY